MHCWSHGLNKTHKSCDCNWPEPGHQKAATVDNMLGGKNTISRIKGERAIYKPPPKQDRPNSRNRNGQPNNETNNDNNTQT